MSNLNIDDNATLTDISNHMETITTYMAEERNRLSYILEQKDIEVESGEAINLLINKVEKIEQGAKVVSGNIEQTLSGGSQGISTSVTISFSEALSNIPSRIIVYFENTGISSYTNSPSRRFCIDSTVNDTSGNQAYFNHSGSYTSFYINNITTTGFNICYVIPANTTCKINSYLLLL